MGTKIWVQEIWTKEVPFYPDNGYARINQGMDRIYKKVLHPDTEVAHNFVPRSSYYTSSIYLKLLNDAELVKGIIKGEKEGYDVAMVSCGNDPGIPQAREAVSIPVVGRTEATMHLACQLGPKIALVTVDPKCIPILEQNLKLYGLEDRVISRKPVRMPEGPEWESIVQEMPKWFDSVEYTREKVIPAFEQVAAACIEDGAEVICTACGGFGCLTLAEYNKVTGTEVPVVENVAAGIKMAELMGDMKRLLGLSTSKHLTYQMPVSPEIMESLSAPFFP